jgi:hypothetical protein
VRLQTSPTVIEIIIGRLPSSPRAHRRSYAAPLQGRWQQHRSLNSRRPRFLRHAESIGLNVRGRRTRLCHDAGGLVDARRQRRHPGSRVHCVLRRLMFPHDGGRRSWRYWDPVAASDGAEVWGWVLRWMLSFSLAQNLYHI